MKKVFTVTFAVVVFFLFNIQTEVLHAQQTDFERFPELIADYHHLELEIEISENLEIRGDASYEFRLLRNNADSLRLNAVRMSIEAVTLNGEETEFRIDDDQLIVALPADITAGEIHQIRVQYRTNPVFGVFRDMNGNIWSSGLPASVRHWLPVMDHPRNSFTTDVQLIFPTGREAVFTGNRGSAEVESVDLQRVRFQSDQEVPVTSLRFAIGDFVRTQSSVGQHRIVLYAERGLLDEEEMADVLNDAYEAFRLAERTLDSGYPAQVLNLVILEDNKWEVRNYGAGVVLAFKSAGNLSEQIANGVTGQWIGVQIREEQWADVDAIMLLRAWLLEQADREVDLPVDHSDMAVESFYNALGPDARAAWRVFFRSSESDRFKKAFDEAAEELMSGQEKVFNWYDFSSILYRHTGRNLLDKPVPQVPDTEEEDADVPVYRVVYHLNEEENRLTLEFIAEDHSLDELVSIDARESTFNDERQREITFTGSRDEVRLNVSPAIENLTLLIPPDEQDRFRLIPEKPFRFWIYQLQHDDDPLKRKEAAVGLRDFTGNPDLQLAILDIIDSEEDPNVKAEVLRTLSYVTEGASGTDQLFIQRFSNNADPEVQLAIAEAFSDYPGNDRVISQLQNILRGSDDVEVQKQAVRSLAAVAEPSRFRSITESILSNESAELIAPFILRELARVNEADAAVTMASTFLEDRFTYQNRVEVLNLLLDYDRSSDRWIRRINRLSNDNDPRIRMRALDGLQFLDSNERNGIIDDRLYEEYDDRVLNRLKMLQS